MQKYLKNNNKGFTLVEVIVVAVIVLVLSAVAIPLYNGYISDSRSAVAENLAGTVATAISAAIQAGTLNPSTLQVTSEVEETDVNTGEPIKVVTVSPKEAESVLSIPSKNANNTIVIPKGYGVTTFPAGYVRVAYGDDEKVKACKAYSEAGANVVKEGCPN